MAAKKRRPARQAKRTKQSRAATFGKGDILHYSVAILVAIIIILVLLRS